MQLSNALNRLKVNELAFKKNLMTHTYGPSLKLLSSNKLFKKNK